MDPYCSPYITQYNPIIVVPTFFSIPSLPVKGADPSEEGHRRETEALKLASMATAWGFRGVFGAGFWASGLVCRLQGSGLRLQGSEACPD